MDKSQIIVDKVKPLLEHFRNSEKSAVIVFLQLVTDKMADAF